MSELRKWIESAGFAGNAAALIPAAAKGRSAAALGLALLVSAAGPVRAETVDFESEGYLIDKSFIGVDQWTQGTDGLQNGFPENFNVQSGNGGKWAHILTVGSTTTYRPFPALDGILELRWKWRGLSDSSHLCLGVSGSGLTARLGSRALACLDPYGAISGTGSIVASGPGSIRSAETWKGGTWYYMRMVLDNAANKFTLYLSDDSSRGTERVAIPAAPMAGMGSFTRLVLRGEGGGGGYADVDDISWEATAVWQGGSASDSNWSTGRNWSGNIVPDSLTQVTFASGSAGCVLDRNASVKSITVASSYKGTLNLGQQVLMVGGKADFTGGNYAFTGAGHIRFSSPVGNALTGPEAGNVLASVRHDGAGALRLDGRALNVANLSQVQGVFDFNGFDLSVSGDLAVKNGQPGTLRNLDGRAVSVGRSARLEGAAKDTLLGLGAWPKGWTLAGGGPDSLLARFALLGNAHATMNQAYAIQSVDAGSNSGWTFPAPPSIIAQPTDVAAQVGETVLFRVSVAGKSGAAYQWYRNNAAIPGAADSVYLLLAVKKADSGSFNCKVTGTTGSVYSASAKLKVAFPAPTIAPAPQTFPDSLSVKMSAPVAGAKLYYSRNGSAWLEAVGAITLRDSTQILAYAVLNGDTSLPAAWNFPKQVLPQLPEPAIDPGSYTFNDSVKVTMTPPIAGALIYYTVDQSAPDNTKKPYAGPFVIKTTTTVSAIAYKTGYRPSPVHTNLYIHRDSLTLPIPTAGPAGGFFNDSIVVKLSPPAAAPQASIYYLLGALGPFKFQDSLVLRQTTTLKAIAISGSQYSDTAQWEFKRRQEAPYALPKSRSFPDTLRVSLACKGGDALIFYTVDGSDPTRSSTLYSGNGVFLDSSATLKAIAVKGTDVSSILSETYTLIPDTPDASPRGGDYSSAINIQLSDKSARALIYYTLDGSTPGPERGLPPYKPGSSIRLDTSAGLKAIAVAGQGAGLQRSAVRSENYAFIRPGPRVLGPGQRIELSGNYSLQSPLAGAAPVNVEVIAADSLKSLKGFRDILFGIRLAVPEGAAAFPTVDFNAPGGEIRSLYMLNPNGSARWITGSDTSQLPGPGTYFLAVDTSAPVITYSGETFTPEDSTRLVVSIQDNVTNLLLDLERSDKKSAGFTGRDITNTLLLAVSLKNPAGSLAPLTIRLRVDDHSLKTVFPADGSQYPLAQRFTETVRTPAAFRIGSNPADPWDLIAVPLAAEPPLTMAQLRSNNSVPELEGVTVNPGNGGYRYLTDDEPLLPGAGVWIAAHASLPSLVFPALQTAGHRGSGAYQLTLRHGWNLVANPGMTLLYWPVTRAFPDGYDASALKGLFAWDAGLRAYATAESLEPWRGYFAYYKGSRDTLIDLRNSPVTGPAQAGSQTPAAKSATEAATGSGFSIRLRLDQGPSLRLGASPTAADGIGVEDDPQPVSPRDQGSRLYSARGGQRLGTDLLAWKRGRSYGWKLVAGLAANADVLSRVTSGSAARVEAFILPEGYSAWAVSGARGLRFPLSDSGSIPLPAGFTDSLEILAGPSAELEARLGSIPLAVHAFAAQVSAQAGRFALDLKLPRSARIRLTLWSLAGRSLESETLDLPDGIYHLVRNGNGRGYAAGVYVLALECNSGSAADRQKPTVGIPRRLSLKIAIP